MIRILSDKASFDSDLRMYLALEEWCARKMPPAVYFFTWVVAPTVIIGRNQDLEKEVNLQYCRDNNINVVRRRSGGGCVFADYGNIMISFVTPSTDVQTTFSELTDRVAGQLRAMGINAESSGRNDIMVDGRKISGNAFYHLPGRSIVHGTMLYDTTMSHMMQAITPDRAKLESKRVTSVSSHIVTARQLLPDMPFDEFHRRLAEGLATDEYRLKDQDIDEVRKLAARYAEPSWLYGRTAVKGHRTIDNTRRFDGVGTIRFTARIDDNDSITDPHLTGDFFMLADLDEGLLDRLRGVPCTQTALRAALDGADTAKVIANLSHYMLVSLITQKP